MLKTLFWLCWLALYLIRKVPTYFKLKRLQRQGREQERIQLLNKTVLVWSAALYKHIKLNLTVEGQENLPQKGEAVLFVSNHQSYVDIPIFLSGLDEPHALVAKKELFQVPLLNLWLRQLGCIVVDREDIRASAAAIKEGEALLASGSSLIICPEGTRTKADAMDEFKGGGMRMAKRAGVPIIPLAIDGTYLVLEGNGYRIQPVDVRLVILPPIDVAGMDKTEFKELPEKLHDMIEAAKDDRPPGLNPPRP